MAAQIVSIFQRFQASHDWTQRELAEFYRVESALIQAGLQLETDRGLTDEGDPWFVFCRTDNGEVFIHFARIDGQYIAVGAALEQLVQGKDFSALVQEMLAAQAWAMAKARNQSNVFLHPAALLIALVGAAFFHSGEAKAAETTNHAGPELRRHSIPMMIFASSTTPPLAVDATEANIILSSVIIGLNGLMPAATAPATIEQLNIDPTAGSDLVAPLALEPLAPAWVNDAAAPVSSGVTDISTTPAALALLTLHPSADQAGLGALPAAPLSIVIDQSSVADLTTAISHTPLLHLDFAPAVLAIGAVLVQSASTDAAEVVQASNILGVIETQPSLTLLTPPPVIADLITHSVPTPLTGSPAVSDASGSQSGISDSVTPPSPGAASNPPTATPSGGLSASSPLVAAAIAHFANEVGVLDVAVSGHEIILYDNAVLKPLAAGDHLESVTFNFTDGSSIYLVGTANEIQGLHLTLS